MKVLITGFPNSGKTTLVSNMVKDLNKGAKNIGQEITHYCTDPQSYCPKGVKGVPNNLDWSQGSDFVAKNWIGKKQIIEGVAIPRALRKWHAENEGLPCDKLIILQDQHKELTKGQRAMAKGMKTVLEKLIKDWPELLDIIEFHPVSS